ncbi:MAG: hypothetical protein LBV67_04495 [Streptococcaceae bacterium]|jgi:hypothetical protein|nr:hypothetical protein [Streptococcaceae bacterium]
MEKYKGGFWISFDNPWETIEFLLDEPKSNDKELCFLTYDANLYGLPNFHTWDKEYQEKIKGMVLARFKDYDGSIYLDGIKIK